MSNGSPLPTSLRAAADRPFPRTAVTLPNCSPVGALNHNAPDQVRLVILALGQRSSLLERNTNLGSREPLRIRDRIDTPELENQLAAVFPHRFQFETLRGIWPAFRPNKNTRSTPVKRSGPLVREVPINSPRLPQLPPSTAKVTHASPGSGLFVS